MAYQNLLLWSPNQFWKSVYVVSPSLHLIVAGLGRSVYNKSYMVGIASQTFKRSSRFRPKLLQVISCVLPNTSLVGLHKTASTYNITKAYISSHLISSQTLKTDQEETF